MEEAVHNTVMLIKFSKQYTFPEFIFRNHMPHENEAMLRESYLMKENEEKH